MQCASVLKRANGWYIHADSRAKSGVWIASPPFMKLSVGSRPELLGKAVLDALKESRESVADCTGEKKVSPLIELAGVKSYTAFATGASHVGVVADGDWLIFTPSRNTGARTGFLYDIKETVEIARTASAQEIGEAVIQAESLCL